MVMVMTTYMTLGNTGYFYLIIFLILSLINKHMIFSNIFITSEIKFSNFKELGASRRENNQRIQNI